MVRELKSTSKYHCTYIDQTIIQTDYRKKLAGTVSDIYFSECSGRNSSCLNSECKFIGGNIDYLASY